MTESGICSFLIPMKLFVKEGDKMYKKPAGTQRKETVTVVLSENEKKLIEKRAFEKGLNRSAYIRFVLLKEKDDG